MARYALVNEDGVVENIVEWDGETHYPVEGELIQLAEDAPVEIGNIYKNGQFSKVEIEKPKKRKTRGATQGGETLIEQTEIEEPQLESQDIQEQTNQESVGL